MTNWIEALQYVLRAFIVGSVMFAFYSTIETYWIIKSANKRIEKIEKLLEGMGDDNSTRD